MLVDDLKMIIGPTAVLSGPDVDARYKIDINGCFVNEPLCVVRPRSVLQISAIVKLCGQAGVPIVPSGGGTGVVGGTVADGAVKLSLELLNQVNEVDTDSGTLLTDAGVTLQSAQEAADAAGLLLPLDIGARGSASIGGVLATNAGGSRVLRWGMARNIVLGLEVVLPDGRVVSSLRRFVKDNAGYDWKHLFIGSEGTLGIITKAVFKLYPKPRSSQTALVAVKDLSSAIQSLRRLEDELSGNLSSFELMWSSFYTYVTKVSAGKRVPPLPTTYPLYCIIEALGADPHQDAARFERALGGLLEAEIADDAVIAQSERERANIWAVREDLFEVVASLNRYAVFDISMPLKDMDAFNSKSARNIRALFPDATLLYYGHAGDGNIHLIAAPNADDPDFQSKMDTAVYAAVRDVAGSISGEHGIGLLKREFLSWSRSSEEIDLMKVIKRAIDPTNVLNPGKVI